MVFRFLCLKHGITFLAFWTGCVFWPEALKRVWRLPLSGLRKWYNIFFKKVSLKKYLILCAKQSESYQGHEGRTLVLDRIWKPQRQTFTQTSLECSPWRTNFEKVSINHSVICCFRVLKDFWLVTSKGTVFHNFNSLFSSLSLYFLVDDLAYWC